MRIGIDFHAAQRDGTGNCTYIRNLVENLLSMDSTNDYYLYVTDPSHVYLGKFKSLKNVALRPLVSDHPLIRIPALGLGTKRDRVDLLHVQYASPPLHHGRLVLTVHDISFVHYPALFRTSELAYLRLMVKASLKHADRILTSSDYSLRDIEQHYGMAAAKTVVTHLGVNSRFRPVPEEPARDVLTKRYGLEGRFILFVGRLDVRKNIPILLAAFDRIKQKKNLSHKLIVAGKSEYHPEKLHDIVARCQSNRDIVFTGYIPDSDLPFFYSQADAFVYPSLYEGFGLPCVEAMACGCPVIASKAAALPEILGEAARFVDPSDVEGLASSIEKVVSDREVQERMRRDGLERARRYDWAATARKTLDVYRNL